MAFSPKNADSPPASKRDVSDMGEKRVQSLEQGSEIKRRPISGLAADFFGSRASRLNPNRRGGKGLRRKRRRISVQLGF